MQRGADAVQHGGLARFRSSRPSALFAIAALLTAACSELPTDPQGIVNPSFNRSSAPGQLRGVGIDAEYARIARDAPGFGGMYYDDSGRLNVYVTEQGRTPAAERAILTRVNASLRAQDRTEAMTTNVIIRHAARDYLELTTLRERMDAVLGQPGVLFTDIDESQNRLRVGVLAGTSIEQIESALQQLDVPVDAVNVEFTEPIVPVAFLNQANDPLAGGLQIWRFIPPGFASICTLGFNVLLDRPAMSQHYFMTNSHCTEVRGEVTGTQFRQDGLFLAARTVAVEVADPAFFTCQFAGFRCRWSDAALAQYLPDFTARLRMIYRTTAVGTTAPSTLEIHEEGKYFTIARERPFPMLGEILDKVGRTTGWTRGPVIATCVNTGVSGSNPPIAMLCQDFVASAVAGGDSGSPVFHQIGISKPVSLYGILWGSGGSFYVFSAMENIREDFGTFRVH